MEANAKASTFTGWRSDGRDSKIRAKFFRVLRLAVIVMLVSPRAGFALFGWPGAPAMVKYTYMYELIHVGLIDLLPVLHVHCFVTYIHVPVHSVAIAHITCSRDL